MRAMSGAHSFRRTAAEFLWRSLFVVVTLVAACWRAVAGDPLRRRREPAAASYWQATRKRTSFTSRW